MPHAASLSLLLLIGAGLQAVETSGPEMDVCDLRLGLGVAKLPTEQDNTYIGVKDKYESSYGFSGTLGGVVGHLAPFGVLYGGEARYINGTMSLDELAYTDGTADSAAAIEDYYGDQIPDSSYTETGLAALIGVGYALSETSHLELLGVGGYNWVTMDRLGVLVGTTNDLVVRPGKGWGYTLGARVGMYWTFPDSGWQYGVCGEYTYNNAKVEVDYVNATVTGDLIYSSYSLRGSVGTRF